MKLLHVGPQLMLSNLRQELWLLWARSSVRQVLYNCVICVWQLRQNCERSFVGARYSCEKSFLTLRRGLCGPYLCPNEPWSRTQIDKIARFICIANRAVHNEVGGVLYNVYAFLACYDRFSSRRSLPIAICSDNGTSFQGTDKEVTAAFRASTHDPNLFSKLANDQVVWNFIPQLYSVSHFGGL